jgi:hypothetical protein
MYENPTTAERIAQNDIAFRKANELISDAANQYQRTTGLLPFMCECAEPGCTEVTQLTRAEYEEVRADPAYFINVPGHETALRGHGRVVREHERFVIVEKRGRAGEIAEQEDPRADEREERDQVA